MARFHPNVPMKKHPFMLLLHVPAASSFMVFLAILCVFSVVTFLCGTHKRAKRETNTVQLGERKRLGSSISSKALLMAKMVSWRKVHEIEGNGGGGGGGDEEAVWKRTIIMGEKCRPVDFSGRILYDSEGNPLPETPPSKSGKPVALLPKS